MTKNELNIALNDFDDDAVVIIRDDVGWSNIEEVKKDGSSIAIILEQFPVFSDN